MAKDITERVERYLQKIEEIKKPVGVLANNQQNRPMAEPQSNLNIQKVVGHISSIADSFVAWMNPHKPEEVHVSTLATGFLSHTHTAAPSAANKPDKAKVNTPSAPRFTL